jgi:hypothetical protein
MTEEPTRQQKHEAWTLEYYKCRPDINCDALRSGYGDAAHMCDAVAADILREHTVRGRVTKRGQPRLPRQALLSSNPNLSARQS